MSNKMNKIFILFLICTIGYLFSIAIASDIPCNKQIAADKIRSKIGKKIAVEKHLQFIGFSAQMLYEVQQLGLSFQGFHNLNIEDARKLMVYAINLFLEEINSDEDIRPYLKQYPFTAKDIKIGIWFYEPDYILVKDPNIGFIENSGGKIKYYSGKEINYNKPMMEEDYKDAINIVEGEKTKMHEKFTDSVLSMDAFEIVKGEGKTS